MFKHSTKTKIFPIAICLIAYLFAWTNAASANILCFGSDGHIAIEKTYQDSCSLEDNSLAKDSVIELSIMSATDTCTDTTVPFNSLNKKFSSDSDNNFIAATVVQNVKHPIEFVEPKSKVPTNSRNLENQNLNFLKTVILTI